jgi:ubiquitin carboxyl-terminal hydrolase L5
VSSNSHFKGAFTNVDKWLDVAKPEIISKMAAYEEDQIEFSMLSLVKDPMVELVARLAGNVKSLSAIDDLLSKAGVADPERQSLPLSDGTVYGPDSSFNLTQEIIDHASIPEIEMSKFQSATCEELRQYRLDIAAEQPGIRASIGEEQQSQRADENYAAGRRHDYGPAVHTWVRMLARKGVAETLVQEITATG